MTPVLSDRELKATCPDREWADMTPVPHEVRAWHNAHIHTAAATAQFVLSLACWERTGTGEAWDQVTAGYSGVIDAWASTISRFYSDVESPA